MSEPLAVVLTSVGTESQAVEIAEELIGRRVATCVNIFPGVRSIYRWKGKICEDGELVLLVKTPKSKVEEVGDTIRELHSYELPEILAFDVATADPDFHAWVLRMVAS